MVVGASWRSPRIMRPSFHSRGAALGTGCGCETLLHRTGPHGCHTVQIFEFPAILCVRVSDPKDPKLVLVAYSVSTVATVVWSARALARERLRARKAIRLGTEAKAPADKEILVQVRDLIELRPSYAKQGAQCARGKRCKT